MEGKSKVRSTWLGGGWLFMARPWSAGSIFFFGGGAANGGCRLRTEGTELNFSNGTFLFSGFPTFHRVRVLGTCGSKRYTLSNSVQR